MTAQAGSSPERHRDLTRPDLPLPGSGKASTAPPPLPPPVPPAPGPAPAPAQAASGENWHRMHYPIGVFLVAYGVTGLVTGLLFWDDRLDEVGAYLGAGLATPALAVVKIVETLLVALTLAGLVRRRDVWFLPALAGWLAGFGVFALLDIFKGKWGGLLEHLVFAGVFALLLFLSYGLSVRARLGRATAPAPPAPDAPAPIGEPAGPGRLTRTQEFALSALNNLQQRVTGPQRQPQPPTPPVPPLAAEPAPPQGQPQPPAPAATPPAPTPEPVPSQAPRETPPAPAPEPVPPQGPQPQPPAPPAPVPAQAPRETPPAPEPEPTPSQGPQSQPQPPTPLAPAPEPAPSRSPQDSPTAADLPLPQRPDAQPDASEPVPSQGPRDSPTVADLPLPQRPDTQSDAQPEAKPAEGRNATVQMPLPDSPDGPQ